MVPPEPRGKAGAQAQARIGGDTPAGKPRGNDFPGSVRRNVGYDLAPPLLRCKSVQETTDVNLISSLMPPDGVSIYGKAH